MDAGHDRAHILQLNLSCRAPGLVHQGLHMTGDRPGLPKTGQYASLENTALDDETLAAATRGGSATENSNLAVLLDLPDDAMVSVPAEFIDLPNMRYADSGPEFRRLIREALAPFPDADLGFFEDQIPHEMEHAAAAQALGCTSRFFFKMIPQPGDDWYGIPGHVWASRNPVSKLAIAAIAAAPTWLSLDDVADLRRMGYQDAGDVADRIRGFNRRARCPLPLPGSVR
jgi:hypothetical protein